MNDSTKDLWAQYPLASDTEESEGRDPITALMQGAKVESVPSVSSKKLVPTTYHLYVCVSNGLGSTTSAYISSTYGCSYG